MNTATGRDARAVTPRPRCRPLPAFPLDDIFLSDKERRMSRCRATLLPAYIPDGSGYDAAATSCYYQRACRFMRHHDAADSFAY